MSLKFVPTQVLLRSEHVQSQLSKSEKDLNVDKEMESQQISEREISAYSVLPTETEGNNANTSWRAIPWPHLRLHPLFRPLPLCEEVEVLSARDLTLFRQDSWQWDALHEGRLTTSKLASICGFYERVTSDFLGIPRSLQGHERVLEAWHHLKHKPPASYSHLQQHRQHLAQKSQLELVEQQENDCWKEADVRRSSDVAAFPYQYNPPDTLPPHSHSRHQITDAFIARLAWGSAQESTALLALLNFVKVKVMVVEVKCFSPFTSSRRPSSSKAMTITRYRPDNRPHPQSSGGGGGGGAGGGVPVWHVPQIQFEMFCAGVSCESARMVVLYFDGAKIYSIERDDEYITLLLRIVEDFYSRYIRNVPSNRLKPPEPNFYQLKGGAGTGGAGITGKIYRNFLLHTQRIAQSARLVKELTADEVQRSPDNHRFFLD